LYEEAHRFAHIVSSGFQQEGRCDFVVITGGPCIMDEAEEIMTALERFYTGWMPGGASQ
jgi:hypothetical protein